MRGRGLIGFSLTIFAFLAIVVAFGFAWIDWTGAAWLGRPPSPNRETTTFLQNYGEFLAIGVAAPALIADIIRDNIHQAHAQNEKIKTARYWVLYNASNRAHQDIEVLQKIMTTAGGEITNTSIDNEQKMLELRDTIESFSSTWTNDDIVSEAISFEFSLLSPVEKRLILKYFQQYNSLEDSIQWIQPKIAKKWDERLPNDDKIILETLTDIVNRLHETSQMAIDTMAVLMHSRKRDFPGFDSSRDELLAKGAFMNLERLTFGQICKRYAVR